jgi:FtsZ-interacting cell division protein YlmF
MEIQSVFKKMVKNRSRLVFSIFASLSFLGASMFAAENTKVDQNKIFLFLAGISTAISISLLHKESDDLNRQKYSLKTDELASMPSQEIFETDHVSLKAGELSDTAREKVVVLELKSFEDTPLAIKCLAEKSVVVIDASLMETATAQRSMDFVAGYVFGTNGHQERIGFNIFLFTPEIFDVSILSKSGYKKNSDSNSDQDLNDDSKPNLKLLQFPVQEKLTVG